MLQREDGIEVQDYYTSTPLNSEFLGFLPLIDDCLQYYTVENIGSDKSIERVTPVFGEYNDSVMTDQEHWYSTNVSKSTREEKRLQHEYYRDEFLQRFETCKYCVWFIGCDDADYFMRFESKESALEYLSTVSSFDEVYENEYAMVW